MLKYEKEVITNFISQIKSALILLEEIKTKDVQILRNDLHILSSAKYNLIVAIEASIDICNHLISKNNFRVPESYVYTFKVMAEQKILEQNFVLDRLVKMARFRNRLVHQYWEVEPDLIYDILQKNLTDFEQLIGQVKEAL